MFADILTKTFYGNTIIDWGIALTFIVGSLVIGKIIYWFIGSTVKKLTEKTETELDDILVDMLEEPFVFFITVFGVWYGLKTLTLSENAAGWIDKAYYILIIVNIAWMITRVFDALIEEYIVPLVSKTDTELDDQLLPLLRKCVKFAVWIVALIMALDNAGYSIGSILAGLGIGGLAFALAAQDTVGNFFGGIAIFVDKPFKVGDRIQVNGHDGIVQEIGMRSTRIRTRYEGRVVIMPNSMLSGTDVVNVSSESAKQVFSVYRLSHEMNAAKIEEAMKILRGIAESNENVQDKAVSGFYKITEYSRDIMLLYRIKSTASNLKTKTSINLEIIRQFEENDIKLIASKPVHTKMENINYLP